VTYSMVRRAFDGQTLEPGWHPWTAGGGTVTLVSGALRLALPGASGTAYTDAQVGDERGTGRFIWRPPLRLEARARASGPASVLYGTAGFGFWNDPFAPGRRGIPRLPRALWFFFGGPQSRMALALDQPPNGWKAATFDAARPLFFGLLPLALPGFLLMRFPALYHALWPAGQRALGVAEAALPGDWLAESHDYAIDWLVDRARFAVDGQIVLDTNRSPRGPLGFIAWVDNQYAVVTPQGHFGWGLVAGGEQWLDLERLSIEMRPAEERI